MSVHVLTNFDLASSLFSEARARCTEYAGNLEPML